MDAPMRIEGGAPVAHVCLDEYGNMKPEAWDEHIGPALTDLQGTADFVGVPEGRNHYYNLFCDAQSDQTGKWGWHHWTSEEILPESEWQYWKGRLDPRTYKQEFLGSFETFLGLAYYTFERTTHVVGELPYDENAPLFLCFDFNQTPGVAVVAQEAPAPIDRTLFLSEVYIERDSKTPMVCDGLLDGCSSMSGVRTCPGYRNHKGLIYLFGDSTGGAGGSSKIAGSDWDLVRQSLEPVFGNRLIDSTVPDSNPRERARVNSFNTRLKSEDGTIRTLIDGRCIMLTRDLEGVCTVQTGSGDIDKQKHKSDGLTHISDAAGYYVVAQHPVHGHEAFERSEFST